MDHRSFLEGEDIPTKRRLDYIVKGIDGRESGRLYGLLRNTDLKIYRSSCLTDAEKDAVYEHKKTVLVSKLEWANGWMKKHGRPVIFTDVNDWRAVGADYDYFWLLRTVGQFRQEESDAAAGISGRISVDPELLPDELK